MAIFRVIIDKKVLNGLKRRMEKAYPQEHIEAIMGKIQCVRGLPDDEHTQMVYIHAFDSIEMKSATRSDIEYYPPDSSIELGTNLKYLGTIHSHPDPQTPGIKPKRRCMSYSADDKKSFKNANRITLDETKMPEVISGIAYIRLQKTRRLFGVTFYDEKFKKLEVVITEDRKVK